ncbi:MAG: hypothetical protein GWP47_03125 [Actinobacteria bacterium]|nr:hypothetical protein [Actinomycetota bacterium]NCG37637.1 hypothetical protein [Actinomycetota bacterium]
MGISLDAQAYQRAAALFGETISALSDAEWELTVSDEWTVISTVAWVVVGDSQITQAIDNGEIVAVTEFDAAVLGSNPVAAWRGTAVAAIASLKVVGSSERVVRHPGGRFAVADLLGQRVTENLVRAWDVGLAAGRPVAVPVDLADACLDFWADHSDAVLAGGVLPEQPIEPPDDADAVTRFLALTGRSARG